jgi:hypothetical protein
MTESDRKALAEGLLQVVELCNEQRWKAHECRVLLRDLGKLEKQQTKLMEKLNTRYSPPLEVQEAVSEAGAWPLSKDVVGDLLFDKTSLKPLELTETVETMFQLIDEWEADT